MVGKQNSEGQLELFNTKEFGAEEILKPRDKMIPAAKNTESSYSAFGWRFQIITEIIFSIKNIQELKSVEVEGLTEDIELYFTKKNPMYIQVKAVQKDFIDATDPGKATLAMNTLINTSNRVGNKYSELVYVANFRNPLNLTDALLESAWKPSMDSVFTTKYNELPEAAKVFIEDRIDKAQKQLKQKNYKNSIENFDRDRLSVSTILFGSDSDTRGVSVLGGTLESLFQEAGIPMRGWRISKLQKSLVEYYFANAGSSTNSEKYITITKEKLVWRVIFEVMDCTADDSDKNVPMPLIDGVNEYVDEFIQDQSQDINIINKIYAGIAQYAPNGEYLEPIVDNYINNEWKKYKTDFPLNEDADIQEYGIKTLIKKIITGQKTVHKITKVVNLK
ncbi:hypothetical protein [Latilactobacillus sakei]|uniref:hypothetical protein n=1 Tax=Latilactobacillus sakei TaxID=1599 RepID=UPI000DC64978|nr:hypothetical protein [Latilactobacillus sakei]SPS07208.1 hypothetical protein LAS9624_01458 [Latilactobacillus sakei]